MIQDGPVKSWKSHEDRLFDVCFFCRLKSSPGRKISAEFKEYIKENLLPVFEKLESILPKGICDRCRLCLGDIIKNGENSIKVLPPNDYQEMVELLRDLPASTRSSICVCFCCEKSKSTEHRAKPGRPWPSPKKEEGIVKKAVTVYQGESRQERVKTLFSELSPKSRSMLALDIVQDLKSQQPSTSSNDPVYLDQKTGGNPVPSRSNYKKHRKNASCCGYGFAN